MRTQFKYKYCLIVKKFLFQAIQFSQTVLIQIIQFRPRSNGNEGVLSILESPSITGTSPSDCLVSYLGHSLEGSYHTAGVQLVYYFTAPTDCVKKFCEFKKYCADKFRFTFPMLFLSGTHKTTEDGTRLFKLGPCAGM